MALSLTERAAKQVLQYMDERGGGLGIRVIVEPSECSGLSYRLLFVDVTEEGDVVHECHGAKVFADEKSMAWLDGAEIDYVQEGDSGGFDIRNPNVKRQCGCGESFYV